MITWGILTAPVALADDLSVKAPEIQESAESNIDLKLYKAEMLIPDSSEIERKKAFPLLLQKVLVRVSGNLKVSILPAIQAALKDPEPFIEQFSYANASLRVNFDSVKVDNLLKKANQLVLNTPRPLVLIWFVVHQIDGTNDVVNMMSENVFLTDLAKSLHETADIIGLPIALPFGDLDDISAISSDDLWKITPKKLQKASKRYDVDAILLVKMKAGQTDPCISRWSLLSSNAEKDPFFWKENQPTCAFALQDGMNQTLRNLLAPNSEESAQKNQIATQKSMIIHVSVTNIQSAQDYQKVLDVLQNQSETMNVQIEKVTPSAVFYVLSIKNSLADFAKNLQKNTQFQLVQQNDAINQLEYEFIGQSYTDIWKGE